MTLLEEKTYVRASTVVLFKTTLLWNDNNYVPAIAKTAENVLDNFEPYGWMHQS